MLISGNNFDNSNNSALSNDLFDNKRNLTLMLAFFKVTQNIFKNKRIQRWL
jgi:hypothetical protein